MLGSLATKIFGSRNDRELKKLQPLVAKVAAFEPQIKAMSDEQLKAQTPKFKERLEAGETLDDLLPEAFATVREAAVRTMGMRPFDVQVLGGIVLHTGCISEMKTGEGKTLTATMPVYLNALTGRGVWVVTVNDYLAKRDAEWMGTIYRWLGMTVGSILHEKNDEERKQAYNCDITYGTNNEFGFDYLRDNMKFNREQLAQRGFFYAIVDEVDSVLIDEARTPLIISGPAEESTSKYYEANTIMLRLTRDEHYTVDEKEHQALFNEEGIRRAEELLHLGNLYEPENIEMLHCLEQSLKAHFLFRRDVDYLVDENEVIIVDQHTGRPMPGRRYSDGLHQALEAKEGVTIEKQNQTLATVTFQNFFRMFEKLSGMTGTAETEASEFLNIYKLECFVIPTNRPIKRRDLNDQVFGTVKEKFDAIVREIQVQHEKGRPVLVGTIAIETSEQLSETLRKRNIRHVVLNAKYHQQEADIVAQAGRAGAVTIATNMAGRGTDIVLGGNPESLAKSELAKNPEADYDALLNRFRTQCEEEKARVIEAGGLCIIGTERHESRRIDNQLRGRSGRQGDPGSSQFFLALEDKLMRLFGSPRLKGMLARNMEPDQPIEHRMVNKAIERAQKSVENKNFEVRKHLLEYDDVMNKQRTTFYKLRHDLMREDPRESLFDRITAILSYVVDSYANLEKRSEKDFQKMLESLRALLHIDTTGFKPDGFQADSFKEELMFQVQTAYLNKWSALELPEEVVSGHERFIMLYMVDQQWKDHMRNMDFLKEGISLQGYAQKNPLIEYKKASFDMFNELMDRIDEEIVKTLIFMQPRVDNSESINRMRRQRAKEEKAMQMAGKEEAENKKSQTFRRTEPKLGRNQICYCGSGKKFKVCHGKK